MDITIEKEHYTYRIGETNINNFGNKITIIKYNKFNDVIVKFDNGYITKATYQQFKKGTIKNPYDKTVYGIGYLGEGRYKPKENNKEIKQYTQWKGMIRRCYSIKYFERQPTYKGCSVCTEWHNFQNFAQWFDENYYEIDGQQMCLDKDILIKGNKMYSPENCIFVPQDINKLFTKSNSNRGKYPIGVINNKNNKLYESVCGVKIHGEKKQMYLGCFGTIEEAFNTYKQFKEKYIKQVADEYRNRIPKCLYNAMYNWKVEIND